MKLRLHVNWIYFVEVNILKISILPKNQEFSWNVLSVRFKTTLLAHWASKCTAMHINFVPKFLNNIKNFEFFLSHSCSSTYLCFIVLDPHKSITTYLSYSLSLSISLCQAQAVWLLGVFLYFLLTNLLTKVAQIF